MDIGGGDVMTILDAARLVAELRRRAGAEDLRPLPARRRPGAASASLDAAQRELGYRPEWSLRRGLGELFAWIDEGGVA